MNILVQVLVWTYILKALGCIPRSGIAASDVSELCMFQNYVSELKAHFAFE